MACQAWTLGVFTVVSNLAASGMQRWAPAGLAETGRAVGSSEGRKVQQAVTGWAWNQPQGFGGLAHKEGKPRGTGLGVEHGLHWDPCGWF